ncbi:MAG: rubrerythrin family protein, partial [Euryarchaeota archaeon]|nr:rubrerythrin family protein [Euryarchaeota archaeon]
AIVGVFNFYTSVVEKVSFTSRFMEMVGILGGVSLISYAIGVALGSALGVSQ